MATVLASLIRAMATSSNAREFLADNADELATLPQLAAKVERVASFAGNKAIGPAERGAGVALFGAIREAFEAELAGGKVRTKSLKDQPVAKTEGTRTMVDVAAIQREIAERKAAEIRATTPQVVEGVKVRNLAKSATAAERKGAKRPAMRKLGEEKTPVKVAPLPTLAIAPVKDLVAESIAFFAATRHMAVTQQGITWSRKEMTSKGEMEIRGAHVVRGDGTEVFICDNGDIREIKGKGVSPVAILRDHAAIIGASHEGSIILRRHAAGQLNPVAAVDQARHLVANRFRRETGRTIDVAMVEMRVCEAAQARIETGPDADLLEARYVASTVENRNAVGAVMTRKGWEPLKDREDVPHWNSKIQGGWIVGPRH